MAYAGTVAGARTITAAGITRQHWLDEILIITPNRTPFLSTLPKFQAENTRVDWFADRLASAGDPENGVADVQAICEDTDASFEQEDMPYNLFNTIHNFRETLSVTDKTDYIRMVDTKSLIGSLLHKKIKLQARKIEFALLHSEGRLAIGSGNAMSPGAQCPRMFGIQQIARHLNFSAHAQWNVLPADMQGTIVDVTESPCKHFLETYLGDLLAAMYLKGAEPRDLWMPINQKRHLSDFSGASTRNIEAEDRALIHTIDVYEGPTGVVVANLHDDVKKSEVLATQTEYLEIAILKPCIAERLAKIGDSNRVMLETSLTLVVRIPAALGKIIGLCPDYELVTEAENEEYA